MSRETCFRTVLWVTLAGLLFVSLPVLFWGWKHFIHERVIRDIEVAGGEVHFGYVHSRWARLLGRRSEHDFANVHLEGAEVDAAWFAERPRLAEFPRVAIFLDASTADDDTVRVLATFQNIEGLSLEDTQVTDAGLAYLRDFANLKRIRLAGTQISDAGLVHLMGMEELEFLNLSDTRATEQGAAELQAALPNCKIVR